jgi:ABC-type polysaccharide/polyol phosphate export permease
MIHRFLRGIVTFMINLVTNRKLILALTKQDFKARFLGSYLGILWAFIQPLITVLIFWFVFEVGFKSKQVGQYPFILWLVAGMFPWFFITDCISSATNAVVENGYLVKKIVFPVEVLPVVKISTVLTIHVFFLIFLIFMFLSYGYLPNLYMLQVIYYLFASICLVLGLSLLTSAFAVFTRDVAQFIAMSLQFGFWITPVFWSISLIPLKYQIFLKLNPVFYIIEGYRDCFINHQWFWEKPLVTLYFWGVTIICLVAGILIFKKLRPHFADVL